MRRGYLIHMKSGRKAYQELDCMRPGDPGEDMTRAILAQAVEDHVIRACEVRTEIVKVSMVVPLSNAEYLKNDNICPICRGEEVAVEPIQDNWQSCTCNDCGYSYCDQYKLAGYEGNDGMGPAGKPANPLKHDLFLVIVQNGELSILPAPNEEDLLKMATGARAKSNATSIVWMEIVEGVDRPRSHEFEWDHPSKDMYIAVGRIPEPEEIS